MRFLFSSTRGTGHLEPLLPYARALQAQGHTVLVAGPMEIGDSVRKAGLEHAPFDHPGDALLGPIWARFRGATPEQVLALAMREIFAGLNAQAALPKLQQTIETWRPDLIVRDSSEFAALVAAEQVRVPHARVAVHLVSFEDENVTGVVAEPLAALRAGLGLAPDAGAGLCSEPCFTAFPASLDEVSVGASGAPAPFRARMPDASSAASAVRWRPAGEDDKPLLYITFGTLAGGIPEALSLYRVALDAVAPLPLRAVLTTGRGFDVAALGAIPSNVQVEAFIPQRDVFEHAAAVLFHGGSGTMHGALAAGLPLIVVPFGADQPFNARRVAAVGAGLALPNADVPALRAALERVLVDPQLRAGARKMAADIAALPPLEHALERMVALASARA